MKIPLALTALSFCPLLMAADSLSDPLPKRRHDVTLISTGVVGVASPSFYPTLKDLRASAALPDPLKTFLGKSVDTREEWMNERAPELRNLFEHYMYGRRAPGSFGSAKVIREDKAALGGKATLREVLVNA